MHTLPHPVVGAFVPPLPGYPELPNIAERIRVCPDGGCRS